MRWIRLMVVCGLVLAWPVMVAVQSEPDEAIATEGADPSMADPGATTPRTIDVSAVESPFANVSVTDTGPVVDEVAPAVDAVSTAGAAASPQATPLPQQKLPPGPPTRWP